MNKTLRPGIRFGNVRIPSSKSVIHRLLICAALGTEPVLLRITGLSKDIIATVNCLSALGAEIQADDTEIHVVPVDRSRTPVKEAVLPTGESGSTLRFLLPVVGALGRESVFVMEGRLPERPLVPYDRLLTEHGMQIRKEGKLLFCNGQLHGGSFALPGNISSQFFSGLLMALPLLKEDSELAAFGTLESASYIRLTEDAVSAAQLSFFSDKGSRWIIKGGQHPSLPEIVETEGDWSNAAFFLCMGALSGNGIQVRGLHHDSRQGDREIISVLRRFGADVSFGKDDVVCVRRDRFKPLVIQAEEIPDLVPILAVLCCAAEGESRITGAARLRMKESDRLKTTADLIRRLGGDVREEENGLSIVGNGKLKGGEVFSWNDHRIAMSAAAAASICEEQIILSEAECVEKSYPTFWNDFEKLSFEKDVIEKEPPVEEGSVEI